MSHRPVRHQAAVDGGNRTESAWLTMADVSRVTGIKYGTVRAWRNRGALPVPDAPHPHAPLWKRDTIERWWEESCDSLLTDRIATLTMRDVSNDDALGGGDVEAIQRYSFGQQTIAKRLLGYASIGSLKGKNLPDPDRRDYFLGTPRWYAESVARWLANDPKLLARAVEHAPDFVENYVRPLMSEGKRTL